MMYFLNKSELGIFNAISKTNTFKSTYKNKTRVNKKNSRINKPT